MTVRARRYGRLCREHFDARGRLISREPEPEPVPPAGVGPTAEAVEPDVPAGENAPKTTRA